MEKWFELKVIFFDMIFVLFVDQQLLWKRKPVIRLSFLAGRGEAAGNGLYLQGPSHLGLSFQAAPSQLYARKFFL